MPYVYEFASVRLPVRVDAPEAGGVAVDAPGDDVRRARAAVGVADLDDPAGVVELVLVVEPPERTSSATWPRGLRVNVDPVVVPPCLALEAIRLPAASYVTDSGWLFASTERRIERGALLQCRAPLGAVPLGPVVRIDDVSLDEEPSLLDIVNDVRVLREPGLVRKPGNGLERRAPRGVHPDEQPVTPLLAARRKMPHEPNIHR